MISLTCGIQENDTNELIQKIEINAQTQKTNLQLPKEKGGRDKLGVQDYQIHTIIYKTDKQQGPTIQHRELYPIPCNNL